MKKTDFQRYMNEILIISKIETYERYNHAKNFCKGIYNTNKELINNFSESIDKTNIGFDWVYKLDKFENRLITTKGMPEYFSELSDLFSEVYFITEQAKIIFKENNLAILLGETKYSHKYEIYTLCLYCVAKREKKLQHTATSEKQNDDYSKETIKETKKILDSICESNITYKGKSIIKKNGKKYEFKSIRYASYIARTITEKYFEEERVNWFLWEKIIEIPHNQLYKTTKDFSKMNEEKKDEIKTCIGRLILNASKDTKKNQ